MIFREYISLLLSKQMSLDSAIRKAMGGVRPARDFCVRRNVHVSRTFRKFHFPRPNRCRESISRTGPLTCTPMIQSRYERCRRCRGGISWTQGALIFYNKKEQKYMSLHELNAYLSSTIFNNPFTREVKELDQKLVMKLW